jgi:hypothetical protein
MYLTKAQRQSLFRLWQRHDCGVSYRAFRRRVLPGWDGLFERKEGCAMIHWCGMWIGIEPDGHAHS